VVGIGGDEAMSGDQFVDPERQAFEAFKACPRDRVVEMLNLIRFRERAAYPADHPAQAEGLSGAEAYRRYSQETAPIFTRVGGTVVWSAVPEVVLIGPSEESWDSAFVARYPTAAAFLEMITDDKYRQAVVHRQAAVETSRLVRTLPRQAGSSNSFA
jgi:uncharacterized protein (DUF1330 family)